MNKALSALLSGFSLRKRRGLREWMEQELTIPEGQLRGQLYRCDSRPWVAAIMPYLEGYKKIWIAACPRTGKSLLGVGYGLWRVCEFGDSAQFVGSEEVIIKEFFKDKAELILLDNPRLAGLLPPKYEPKQTTGRTLRLQNGGVIRLIYNPASIRSYDASCLVATEVSQFRETRDEGDMITLAQRRQDDHHGGLQFFESTQTRDTTRFAKEIRGGTDSRLLCPCPHCGHYFEAGIRATIKGWDVKERADVKPYMQCPECAGEITEKDRPRMLKKIRVEHRRPDAESFSITINWFHAKKSLQEVGLAEWTNKNEKSLDSIRDLFQNIYSLPITLEMENPEAETADCITKDMILARVSGYPSGGVAPGCEFTVAAIDCQKSWLYWLVLGYGADTSTYWLDWGTSQIVPYEHQGKITATKDMVLRTLDETYRMVSGFNPLSVWVDTSYKSEASDAHIIREWCGRFNNVFPIAGRAATEFYKMKNIQQDLPPQVLDYLKPSIQTTGQALWFLNADRLKTSLQNKFCFPRDAAGGVYFPRDTVERGAGIILRHLTAEKPERVRSRTGLEVIRWKPTSKRNDLWDCSNYAYAGCLLHAAIRRQAGANVAATNRQAKAAERKAGKANRINRHIGF